MNLFCPSGMEQTDGFLAHENEDMWDMTNPKKRECTYLWKWLGGSWFMIRRTRIFHVTWMMKPFNQHSQCVFCVG